MSYFAVIRDAGPAWADGKGAFEQPDVEAHVTFMNGLADEAAIHSRLAEDPWAATRRIVTTSVEPWNLFVGANRMATIS